MTKVGLTTTDTIPASGFLYETVTAWGYIKPGDKYGEVNNALNHLARIADGEAFGVTYEERMISVRAYGTIVAVGIFGDETFPRYDGIVTEIGDVTLWAYGTHFQEAWYDINQRLRDKAEELGGNLVMKILYRSNALDVFATGKVVLLDPPLEYAGPRR